MSYFGAPVDGGTIISSNNTYTVSLSSNNFTIPSFSWNTSGNVPQKQVYLTSNLTNIVNTTTQIKATNIFTITQGVYACPNCKLKQEAQFYINGILMETLTQNTLVINSNLNVQKTQTFTTVNSYTINTGDLINVIWNNTIN